MAFWLSNKQPIENGPQPQQQQPNKPEITTDTQNKPKNNHPEICANKTTTTTTKKNLK